jgi:hypothetical protein
MKLKIHTKRIVRQIEDFTNEEKGGGDINIYIRGEIERHKVGYFFLKKKKWAF